LIGLISAQSQAKPSNGLYAEPARLMLPGDENEDEEFERGNLIREKIYPIGWSKDGKFAFVSEPADEACDCYYADFIIQDLRTDKILWTNHFEGTEGGEENLQTYWKKNQKLFSRKLAQYGIQAQKTFALQNSGFIYKGDDFAPEIQNKTTINEDRKVSGSVSLQLILKGKGKKNDLRKKI
jgi:hypothetical protein